MAYWIGSIQVDIKWQKDLNFYFLLNVRKNLENGLEFL